MKAKHIILLAAGCLLTACELEKQPISEIGEGSFYKTTEQINNAVLACYNGMQEPLRYEWMLTELRSDNTRLQNTATTSTQNTMLMDFDQSRVSATSEYVYNFWKATYHNIARCNTVLEHFGAADTTMRAQYEGEARLIRANHYFNLVRLFGPVFVIKERISANEAKKLSRQPVDMVYALIEEDLQTAISQLPDSYESAQLGRLTSWAAKSLMAKVRMTRGQIDATTRDLLADVVENSGYDLEPTYADVFDINNEVNREMIFVVRYTSGGKGLGSPFGNMFAPLQSGSSVINGGGNGYNYPTDDLVGAYTSADTRRDVSLALDYTNDVGTVVDRRYVKKFLSPVVLKEDGDKDWPVIRYADVLLLYAEVLNELEGPSAALPHVNRTRTRAGLAELPATAVANKQAMRTAIEKERRLELAFENHRWYDLLRNGRAIEVISKHWDSESYYQTITAETGALTLNDNLLLLPVPQKEIDINQDITQNMGY